MSENIWDDEEFRDNVVERVDGQWIDAQIDSSALQINRQAIQQEMQPKTTKKINPDFSQIEDMMQEVQEDNNENESDDFSEILNDANLRIEQGRLYQLIMNSDIFGNDSIENPRAAQNVQKEIRKFAKERMEIMLGMREEKEQEQSMVQASNPFNSLEIHLLKELTFKMSQGKTAEPQEEEPRQIAIPKKTVLNKISTSKPASKLKQAQPLKKSSQPLKRYTRAISMEEIAISNEEVPIEAIDATFDKNYTPLSKPIAELSQKEQAERLRQTNERLAKNRRADNPNKVPMPSYEQQEQLAASMAAAALSSGSKVSNILANLNRKSVK